MIGEDNVGTWAHVVDLQTMAVIAVGQLAMSTAKFWVCVDDRQPEFPGWYPTYIILDENEGLRPIAAYWTGERWSLEVHYFLPAPCRDHELAEEIAKQLDPEAQDYRSGKV